jgi:glyoxylase-like metal-dependent hydrolase (beta-lactamase superfamily II)
VPGSPRALHTPGHTPGSAAIAVEKRNALLAGDAMCTWNPYTGRVGPQIMPFGLHMSSAQAMASLDALLAVRSGPTSQSRRPLVTRRTPAPPVGVHAPARRARLARAPRPPACPPTPSAPATLPAYT